MTEVLNISELMTGSPTAITLGALFCVMCLGFTTNVVVRSVSGDPIHDVRVRMRYAGYGHDLGGLSMQAQSVTDSIGCARLVLVPTRCLLFPEADTEFEVTIDGTTYYHRSRYATFGPCTLEEFRAGDLPQGRGWRHPAQGTQLPPDVYGAASVWKRVSRFTIEAETRESA